MARQNLPAPGVGGGELAVGQDRHQVDVTAGVADELSGQAGVEEPGRAAISGRADDDHPRVPLRGEQGDPAPAVTTRVRLPPMRLDTHPVTSMAAAVTTR